MKNSFLKMKIYWNGVFLGTSTVSSIRICPLKDMVSLSLTIFQAARDCRHINVLMFNRAFLLGWSQSAPHPMIHIGSRSLHTPMFLSSLLAIVLVKSWILSLLESWGATQGAEIYSGARPELQSSQCH